MKTFKLLTSHQETHIICTNRGPAFTKGDQDPTMVKEALIDRAVCLPVRTLGDNTRTDDEFHKHLADPEVQNKLRVFRIFTCLVALVKMIIFRCAAARTGAWRAPLTRLAPLALTASPSGSPTWRRRTRSGTSGTAASTGWRRRTASRACRRARR